MEHWNPLTLAVCISNIILVRNTAIPRCQHNLKWIIIPSPLIVVYTYTFNQLLSNKHLELHASLPRFQKNNVSNHSIYRYIDVIHTYQDISESNILMSRPIYSFPFITNNSYHQRRRKGHKAIKSFPVTERTFQLVPFLQKVHGIPAERAWPRETRLVSGSRSPAIPAVVCCWNVLDRRCVWLALLTR